MFSIRGGCQTKNRIPLDRGGGVSRGLPRRPPPKGGPRHREQPPDDQPAPAMFDIPTFRDHYSPSP